MRACPLRLFCSVVRGPIIDDIDRHVLSALGCRRGKRRNHASNGWSCLVCGNKCGDFQGWQSLCAISLPRYPIWSCYFTLPSDHSLCIGNPALRCIEGPGDECQCSACLESGTKVYAMALMAGFWNWRWLIERRCSLRRGSRTGGRVSFRCGEGSAGCSCFGLLRRRDGFRWWDGSVTDCGCRCSA